jgi:hypothetical protein
LFFDFIKTPLLKYSKKAGVIINHWPIELEKSRHPSVTKRNGYLCDIIINMEVQPANQLNIEISEEVAEGSYANLAIITHSNAEFVIDFVNVMPGTPKSKVKSRVIFTPMHAKRFMKALQENISRFEASNGTIKDLEQIEIPMNFGGLTGQA